MTAKKEDKKASKKPLKKGSDIKPKKSSCDFTLLAETAFGRPERRVGAPFLAAI